MNVATKIRPAPPAPARNKKLHAPALLFGYKTLLFLPMHTAQLQLQISDRIQALEESQTIAMAKKGRELAAQGKDVINLSFGEPDFDTPEHIRTAAKQAIDEGWSHYPPVAGYPELRRAIADKFWRENGLAYTPEQIVVSTGAKQSIANLVLCTVNPGDEVLILGPYWVSYLELVKLAEGVPVVVNGTYATGFKPTIDQIADAITSKTRLIMFSAPSNPTGALFSEKELADIAAFLQDYPQVIVMADEIYEHLNYTGRHHSLAAQPGMLERTVTINGLSKAFAMTGWRLGYMGAPLAIAKAVDKMQGQFTSGANSIAQRAAITALTTSLAPTEAMRDQFKIRRDACVATLSQIKDMKLHTPDAAFYLFPDVSAFYGRKTPGGKTITNDMDLCLYILEEHLVSLVPGSAFGDADCIRLSFAAADEDLARAMDRLVAAFAGLS